jgi:hypothetical protein
MEAFQKKYSEKLTKVMRRVYELDRRKNICLRKSMIKTIKTTNVQAKQNILIQLKNSNDLIQIQKINAEIDREVQQIGVINEFLKDNSTATLRANEIAVENLAKHALNTTTASLIKNYLDEYKHALSKDQDAKDKEEIREKEMEDILVQAEINVASKIREQNLKILENLNEMDNYAPLTQRVLKDTASKTNLPSSSSSSSESEFGQIRISDLFPRKFLSSEISRMDSFEFGPLKEEIEYTSTQIPGIGGAISKETDKPYSGIWLDEDIAINCDVRASSEGKTFATRSSSIIYIDKVESKLKDRKHYETECITIDDSSDIEEQKCYVERRGNKSRYF